MSEVGLVDMVLVSSAALNKLGFSTSLLNVEGSLIASGGGKTIVVSTSDCFRGTGERANSWSEGGGTKDELGLGNGDEDAGVSIESERDFDGAWFTLDGSSWRVPFVGDLVCVGKVPAELAAAVYAETFGVEVSSRLGCSDAETSSILLQTPLQS